VTSSLDTWLVDVGVATSETKVNKDITKFYSDPAMYTIPLVCILDWNDECERRRRRQLIVAASTAATTQLNSTQLNSTQLNSTETQLNANKSLLETALS